MVSRNPYASSQARGIGRYRYRNMAIMCPHCENQISIRLMVHVKRRKYDASKRKKPDY